MSPKVSIIVPVYNTGEYLRPCLDSALAQTLEDIEIICVNDGSTDHSPDILAEYAAADRRVRIINKPNGGLSSARNAGIDAAVGEYIYFFDSDDLIVPELCEELYQRASSHRLDNIFFDAEVFFESRETERQNTNYINYYVRTQDYPDTYTGCELFTAMHPAGDYRPSACLQFIRRQFLLDRGLRFYEGIIHEDNLFTFLCITQAEKAEYANKAYFKRRVRDNSIMTAECGVGHFNGYFVCLLEMIDYIEQRTFDEDTAREAGMLVLSIFRNAATNYHRLPMNERPNVRPATNAKEHWLMGMIRANIGKEVRQVVACKDCEITRSLSYRLGRLITFIPRKIYRGFLCAKDHGFGYTIALAFKKLIGRG
ncbi:MAG: glycosyltransferase [Ruminococcaceae bacterium]|nr:glycosyltransferase [Oscillospiraceae bacterium]